MTDKENGLVKTQSLLLPIGWGPWVVALLGGGIGAGKAAAIVKSTRIYGTAPGDMMIIQSALLSAALSVAFFVGVRTIWRWIRRRGN